MSETREINFGKYCPECVSFNIEESEEPCRSCLNCSIGMFSEKPIKFKKGNRDENIKKMRRNYK